MLSTPIRKKVLFLINPTAGRGRGLSKANYFHSLARSRGISVDFFLSSGRDTLYFHTLQVCNSYDLLVVFGGDGSLREVIQGLYELSSSTPVVPYPSGTSNSVSRSLFSFTSDLDFFNRILISPCCSFDLGLAKYSGVSRIFFLCLGAGFDAQVVYYLSQTRRGPIFLSSYFYPFLRAFFNSRPKNIKLSSSFGDFYSNSLVVSNLPYYGSHLRLSPSSLATDGVFETLLFRASSNFSYLPIMFRALFSDLSTHSSTRILNYGSFTLSSDEEVFFQLDGDFSGSLPVEVSILPHSFNMLSF